jgi:predicted RNA-binding Zn ribbon-like protein
VKIALRVQEGKFMQKALHDEVEVFFTFQRGELIAWHASDVDMLIRAANDAPEFETTQKDGFTLLVKDGVVVPRISEEETFCIEVNDWMCELVDNRVTDEMIDELNSALADLRYVHVLMRSEDGRPYWQRNIADMNRPPNVEVLAAHAFAHLLTNGGLKGLKRCALPDCEKFFIGRPNAKWCSKSCGSKHRVRRKRKRDI